MTTSDVNQDFYIKVQNGNSPRSLSETDWRLLLERIKDGRCTPFLGAGVNYGLLPLGPTIAQEWAKEEGFPLLPFNDLPSVAQFLAVKYDPMLPKSKILKRLQREPRPDFGSTNPNLDCLRALAELPLPVYVTTNYDDFLVEALKHAQTPKQPRRGPVLISSCTNRSVSGLSWIAMGYSWQVTVNNGCGSITPKS